MEQYAAEGEWLLLHDWEVVERLKRSIESLNVLRKDCAPLDDLATIRVEARAATAAVERGLDQLDLAFRVPYLEPLAVLWPGVEVSTSQNSLGDSAE